MHWEHQTQPSQFYSQENFCRLFSSRQRSNRYFRGTLLNVSSGDIIIDLRVDNDKSHHTMSSGTHSCFKIVICYNCGSAI